MPKKINNNTNMKLNKTYLINRCLNFTHKTKTIKTDSSQCLTNETQGVHGWKNANEHARHRNKLKPMTELKHNT